MLLLQVGAAASDLLEVPVLRGQVIVRSGTFIHAVQKMQRALFEFHVRGVKVRSSLP